MFSRYALAAGVMALVLLVASACVVEVTPHGAGVYSVRPVTLQAAPDVTPTPEALPYTATPAQPCVITTSSPKNVRSAPWGAIIDTLPANTPTRAAGSATDEAGRVWWQIENPAGFVAGWVVQAGPGC